LQSAPPSAATDALRLEDLKVKFLPTMAAGYEQAVYLEEIGGKERDFTIGKDELKWAPLWLESDGNFWSHLSAGSLQVLGSVQEDEMPSDLRESNAQLVPEAPPATPPVKPDVKPAEPIKPPIPQPAKPAETKSSETPKPENKSETK